MSKKQKISRPRARLPKGLIDTGASDIRAMQAMLAKIRAVYERYGFEPLETPAFEYTDALGKFLPDRDRPNEGVFSFQDEDEQWLSLRYDLTAPLARYVAQNFNDLPKPFRRYQVGPVWRNEKPGPGRFREFLQFDADTVGAASVAADAEMCMLAADTLEALGIPRGDYVIRVNNRVFLENVIKSVARTEQWDFVEPVSVMRSLDKLDRLGWDAVRLLLTTGRRDESGDFTSGNGLSNVSANILIGQLQIAEELNVQTEPSFIPTEDEADVRDFFEKLTESYMASVHDGEIDLENSEIRAHSLGLMFAMGKQNRGFQNVREILEIVRECGYGSDRIRFDPTCVRGLEYYTGPVFEAELTFEVKSAEGGRFGSVGGGGRYDGLVQRFTGQPVPATGFSIGVSRLAAALQALGKLEGTERAGPVVVTVFNKESTADSQKLVTMLREAGIRAEMYLGNPKNMGAQFKYADQRGSPCAVIQGPDEKEKGEVQIKDLIEGAKAAATIQSNEEWRESRQGQFAVKESELVEAVRNVLSRYES